MRTAGLPEFTKPALCEGEDTALFYPEPNTSPRPALRICGHCLARDECLTWALNLPERHGIWGGTTEKQRHRLRKGNP